MVHERSSDVSSLCFTSVPWLPQNSIMYLSLFVEELWVVRVCQLYCMAASNPLQGTFVIVWGLFFLHTIHRWSIYCFVTLYRVLPILIWVPYPPIQDSRVQGGGEKIDEYIASYFLHRPRPSCMPWMKQVSTSPPPHQAMNILIIHYPL